MPPTQDKGNKGGKKGSSDLGGLSPQIMVALMNKIPKNPATGKVDIMDVMRYMEQNPSEMEKSVGEIEKHEGRKPKVDLSTYDFKVLAPSIIHESFWVLQLEQMGMVDQNGREIDPSMAHSSTGARPAFTIYCYEENGTFRITQDVVGLPDAKTVLETLKRAIAEPITPLKPCLPWFLMISIKFQQHVPSLKPFLDCLPAPFHWRLETREEAQGVLEGIHDLNQSGIKTSMELAEKVKLTGNRAFGLKDRQAALKAYGEAISYLNDVFCQKPDSDQLSQANKLQAICYANRAAAHMIPGDGIDPKKALGDGLAAAKADPSYGKAYIRQASASQLLQDKDGVLDAIARALRRKELENDVNLVERLIELTTDGKGLPDDEATFKDWITNILINDKKSAARMQGIKGEWKRRCDAQFAKWKR